uniref:Photosystem II M protein n=1 Tax=Nothotsuga longibracteata TaxID=123601 RepID=A0A1X9IXA5_9CONI|nr:PsbM [Nothotsuga longibracteata]QHZ32056.1 photosystem II M protein [Nothotsuga longibracteata]
MEVNDLGFVAIVLFVGFPTAFLFIPYAKTNA